MPKLLNYKLVDQIIISHGRSETFFEITSDNKQFINDKKQFINDKKQIINRRDYINYDEKYSVVDISRYYEKWHILLKLNLD